MICRLSALKLLQAFASQWLEQAFTNYTKDRREYPNEMVIEEMMKAFELMVLSQSVTSHLTAGHVISLFGAGLRNLPTRPCRHQRSPGWNCVAIILAHAVGKHFGNVVATYS